MEKKWPIDFNQHQTIKEHPHSMTREVENLLFNLKCKMITV